MTVNEAIKAMREWASSSPSSYAPYCLSYLKGIPAAIDSAHEYNVSALEGLKVQILYALNNAGGWRGEIAREAKNVLRKWLK